MATKKKAKSNRVAKGRNDQVIRVLQMLKDLSYSGSCTLEELAVRYGTTTRTIRRDLKALEFGGYPLVRESDDEQRGRWSLNTDLVKGLTSLLDVSHYIALQVAMKQGRAARGNEELFPLLEDLSDRVEKALGKHGREKLRALDQVFFSWDKFAWTRAPASVLLLLVDAIVARRACKVTYRAPTSGNKDRSFEIHPLRLFVHNGALYLHAWTSAHQRVLLLNLHRLSGLKLLGHQFERPAAYDTEALEKTAFGIFIGPEAIHFELHFDAYARPYIEERTWHPTEQKQVLPDGGLKLTFDCPPSYEVTNWVSSWGKHVEVVAPQSLRTELREYAAFLLERYADARPK